MKAIWNNQVLAESNETIVVDNNHYFPPSSLIMAHFSASDTTSHCPWKDDANYYNVVVDDKENKDAAWYYSSPKDAAGEIKDHVAFWRGVKIEE
jgi:uncharacterized protein (DUF427 family)